MNENCLIFSKEFDLILNQIARIQDISVEKVIENSMRTNVNFRQKFSRSDSQLAKNDDVIRYVVFKNVEF
jgi:hypothetical protein